LAQQFPNVRVVQRRFDSFADQCNFGLDQLHSQWVLSLDADYGLSDTLVQELIGLEPPGEVGGYRAAVCYYVFGRPLNASLYPARTVLYRRAGARYENDGHAHRVQIAGRIEALSGKILHDDRKPLASFIQAQSRYMKQEAEKLLRCDGHELTLQDRIRRKIVLAPVLVLFYTLFRKGLIFDGWRGWYYVFQRTLSEIALSLYLIESKMHGVGSGEQGAGTSRRLRQTEHAELEAGSITQEGQSTRSGGRRTKPGAGQ
jgi:hypothetical protein